MLITCWCVLLLCLTFLLFFIDTPPAMGWVIHEPVHEGAACWHLRISIVRKIQAQMQSQL